VYVLECADAKMYTGYTNELDRRMQEHEQGIIHYTKTRLPIRLAMYLVFDEKQVALDFEQYLKSGSGRAFAQKRFR